MLNYAFPYDSPEIGKLIANLSRVLADTLKTQDKAVLPEKFKSYRLLRQQLKNILSPDDYKYISLQLWTEGIARYTEYRIAELTSDKI